MGRGDSKSGRFMRRAVTTASPTVPYSRVEDRLDGGIIQEEGRVQPFEVELLGDVDGEVIRPTKAKGKDIDGNAELSLEDAWMRNIWALPNRAVVHSYFCVGFALKFLSTPLTYYMVHELDASPAQQNVMLTLAMLPWSFKLVYGFVSDSFPIMGMRRKPYFVGGWAVFVFCNLITANFKRPSIQWLAGQTFISTVGFMLSDVSTDAILVERSKHEISERRGSMQATAYIVRFFGSIVGAMMGTALFNKDIWGWGLSIANCFLINALVPVVLMGPFVWHLQETNMVLDGMRTVERIKAQSREVFSALTQKAVYVPMLIIFIYNMFQVPNAAWRSFLVEGLEFSNFKLGLLGIAGSVFATAGLFAYKRFFFQTGWHKIYIWCTLFVTLFSLFQLLLIKRVNLSFGISDVAFSIGDDIMQDFVQAIQFLPLVQMFISMCPDGVEGTTYAILTTLGNVAQAAAYDLGTVMTGIWDVSNDTLRAGNFDGILKLTILTSLIQPLPLVLIRYLPNSKEDQRILQQSEVRNNWGGVTLLFVLFSSLAWTVREALDNLA